MEQEIDPPNGDISPASNSYFLFDGTGGKPGLISFYNRPYKREDEVSLSTPEIKNSNLLWLVGPAVLVASFIFPSLYLRKLILTIFEDSLLTGEGASFLLFFFFIFFFQISFCCVLLMEIMISGSVYIGGTRRLSRHLELFFPGYNKALLFIDLR